MAKPIAIIGAGQAAAVAASTLRRHGHDSPITIVGDEPHRPYQRPPLSKEYLANVDDDELFLLPEQWCGEHDVDLRLGTAASRIRPERAAVELVDGTEIAAESVLITTGGRARRLPGVCGERVHYLRTLDDAERLRGQLRPGTRLAVIGAGFIGSEVAATACGIGAEVALIDSMDVPMAHLLGQQVGSACIELHRRNGVELRLGESVWSVTETTTGVVVTTSGGMIEADAVVVGVGIEPNTAMASASGIAIDNGVLVDERCRTSMANVFAAGDVANHQHPLFGQRVRVEHFDNANRQAMAAASSILGRGGAFSDPHWFWSDQYEWNLQHTGQSIPADEVVVRGAIADLDFMACYLREGSLCGAFAIDRGTDVMAAKELIAAQAQVAPEILRDEDTDLMELTMPQEQT